MSTLMIVDEVAEYLRMNRLTVYRLAQQGRIPCARVGKHWRFDRELIDDWLRGQAEGRPAQVLVVDDEETIGRLFKEALERKGFKVVAVRSGPDALSWMASLEFDLIFLDLVMPGMDGAEAFAKIRQLDPDVPVVIITAYPDSDLMAQALEQGPFGVMKKPFTAEEIRAAAERFVGSVSGKGRSR